MKALRELIEEWMRVHDGSQAELAARSGVAQNVISRWLNRQVDDASPKNLKRIAPVLGLTYEELLRRMGEIPDAMTGADDADAALAAIRGTTAEMAEVLRGLPRVYWGTIIKAFSRGVDGARDMAQLLADAATGEDIVSSSDADELRKQDRRSNGGDRRRTDHLADSQVGALALLGSI